MKNKQTNRNTKLPPLHCPQIQQKLKINWIFCLCWLNKHCIIWSTLRLFTYLLIIATENLKSSCIWRYFINIGIKTKNFVEMFQHFVMMSSKKIKVLSSLYENQLGLGLTANILLHRERADTYSTSYCSRNLVMWTTLKNINIEISWSDPVFFVGHKAFIVTSMKPP